LKFKKATRLHRGRRGEKRGEQEGRITMNERRDRLSRKGPGEWYALARYKRADGIGPKGEIGGRRKLWRVREGVAGTQS